MVAGVGSTTTESFGPIDDDLLCPGHIGRDVFETHDGGYLEGAGDDGGMGCLSSDIGDEADHPLEIQLNGIRG